MRINRIFKLRAELEQLFLDDPNELFSIKNIRAKFIKNYSESEIYSILRILYNDKIINRKMLLHKTYYWLYRDKNDYTKIYM
jgi:hypothetical protein